jgi:hypothetical protein
MNLPVTQLQVYLHNKDCFAQDLNIKLTCRVRFYLDAFKIKIVIYGPGSWEGSMKLLVTQLTLYQHKTYRFSHDFNIKLTCRVWFYFDVFKIKIVFFYGTHEGPENAVWSCQWQLLLSRHNTDSFSQDFNYKLTCRVQFCFVAYKIKIVFYVTRVLRTQYEAASDSTTIIPTQ